MSTSAPDLDAFLAEAREWLDAHLPHRRLIDESADEAATDGAEFSVAVFHALSVDEERQLLDDLCAYSQAKAERGYHAIAWPADCGGLGLPRHFARAFGRLEGEYALPTSHETHSVTTRLIAPTVQMFGNEQQRRDLVPAFLAAEVLCCQLFSEPGAGSDLATLACRAERDGEEWVINGQKVWSSGAQFSQWGELIARSDPDAPKHVGLTAFIIPMDLNGIEIRPIRQMSGGASFNEVFFTDVRVPDSMRLGEIGQGWKVALTTLGFERDHSDSSGTRVGGSWRQLLAAATRFGVADDSVIRQHLMRVYTHHRLESWVNRRAADLRRSGAEPGPESSLGKLMWTAGMTMMSEVIGEVLGPRLIADSGEWATYAWGEHVLGAPGYRIAGGSDEIQRNIIAERVLGLPPEPRVDKDTPWREIAR
jgi:alkylation response protein AidB-like acyl-CoA dehydrogenase